MRRAPLRSHLQNTRIVFCLDLHWGGRVYRVATEPTDLNREDGSVVHYHDGLSEPDFRDETDRDGTQENAGQPLSVRLDGVDVAERVSRGHRLEAARGYLFVVFIDQQTNRSVQTYAERFPLLTGRLSRPSYADPELPVSALDFTLLDEPGEDSSTLIDPEAAISDKTWNGAPAASKGKVYPTIIGTPGVFNRASGSASTTSGSPAYVIATSSGNATKLLAAGHEVVASTVTVFDDDSASESFSVTMETDGLGRLVAVLDVSGASTISRTSTQYWLCWNGGGGMPSLLSSGAMTGLGDVCAWALTRTSIPVDLEAWVAEGAVLDRVPISTYINEPTLSPWSFVSRLLDDLFVEVRPGPLGLYPMGRLLDTDMAEGLALIVEGPEMEPVGPMVGQTELADVINAVTIRFAPRAKTGDYKRTLTVTPEPNADNDEEFSDEYAVMSVNRWSTDPGQPVIQSETLTLAHIYDDSGAALIARERVRVQGMGYSVRPYRADRRFGWLRAGDQFRLESPSLHQTFLVTLLAKVWNGTGWSMTLAFDEDPIRQSSLKKTGT